MDKLSKNQKKLLSIVAAIVIGVLGYFGIDLSGENDSQVTDSQSQEVNQADNQENEPEANQDQEVGQYTDLDPDGHYTDEQNVADFIEAFGELPDNYLTKDEAHDLGWVPSEGNLQEVAPGMSIGGDYFGNFEGLLPEEEGRDYYEADVNYDGGHRGAERLVFSNDGLYFYTDDHYESFEQLEVGD